MLDRTRYTHLLLKNLFGIQVPLISQGLTQLSFHQRKLLDKKLEDLEQGMPLDYVLELVSINGYKFNLTTDVLIPRPETEELIELIQQDTPSCEIIVDIGTGSGFIAIQMADYYKRVLAVDISKQALLVCKSNIKINDKTNIITFEADLLNHPALQLLVNQESWCMVANLPYVPAADKITEKARNTQFEPDIAIYSGEDGLDVFRKLLNQLTTINLPKSVYFELDPRNIQVAYELLGKFKYSLKIVKDAQNHDRFLVGKLIVG